MNNFINDPSLSIIINNNKSSNQTKDHRVLLLLKCKTYDIVEPGNDFNSFLTNFGYAPFVRKTFII